MKNSLVAISSSHEARIFEKIGHELSLISRLDAELDTNHEKPGRTFNSVGVLRHSIEPHTDRREVEQQKFARKIADNLAQAEKEKPYDGLIILASHQILNELEEALSNQLRKKITHKSAKDLVKFTDFEVQEYLARNIE